MTYLAAALIVACPMCNAKPGEPCIILGVPDARFVHAVREDALHARNAETGTIR